MAAEPKSLDIAEKQVLIDYWDDPAEFYWHHRILLLSIHSLLLGLLLILVVLELVYVALSPW